MERTTMPGRALATLAGAAFAIASLTILLDKQLLHPLDWTSTQWLTILMVFGVLAAGHLMVTAWKAGHLPSAGGFWLLFVVGTGLVVYSSTGRQIESAGLSTMSAEDANSVIADKRADLKDARERLAYANGQVQKLMTGKSCSNKACRDWKTNAKDVTAAIKSLEADIAELGPRKPVNAQAEAMADILLLFPIPASKGQLVALLTLLVPFAKTLFFEIGAIVSLGFAFRPRQRLPSGQPAAGGKTPEETFSEVKAEALENVRPSPLVSLFSGELPDGPKGPTPPKGGRKTTKKRFPENVVPIRAGKHPVERALEKNGGFVSSNGELASLLSVSDGEASKSWREIEDRLIVTRRGKHVHLALRA